MALTIAGILAGLGAAGGSVYAATQAGDGGGPTTGGAGRRVGVPYVTGGQSYLSRLFALNAATPPPSFADYVKSGGTATFPMAGVGQFTPREAQQLNLVGTNNQPMPWFDPTAQNRLTEAQAMEVGAKRRQQRQQGIRIGPMTPEELLAQYNEQVLRQERSLRTGKMGFKRGQRVSRKLASDRDMLEKLRGQLFGSANAPGPYEYSPVRTANRPADEDGESDAVGGALAGLAGPASLADWAYRGRR